MISARAQPAFFVLLAACSGTMGPVDVDVTEEPRESLASYNFLRIEDGHIVYNEGVVPYDLNSPLFSDYALKDRALWIPEGASAVYDDRDVFEFPVGTALLKSFSYPADFRSPDDNRTVIETRLMLHEPGGWKAYPYAWNDDQTDAHLELSGEVLDVTFIDAHGDTQAFPYLIPQKNQCLDCHELKDDNDDAYFTPIGPKARHLHRDNTDGVNQLEALAASGKLTGMPAITDIDAVFPLDNIWGFDTDAWSYEQITSAARGYLDVNCSHCHVPNAVEGDTSRLWLDVYETDPFHLGVCKRPGSAGKGGLDRTFDIVPGDHEASILHYRMVTDDLGAMMPEIGRTLIHQEAADLIAAWIDGMEGTCE